MPLLYVLYWLSAQLNHVFDEYHLELGSQGSLHSVDSLITQIIIHSILNSSILQPAGEDIQAIVRGGNTWEIRIAREDGCSLNSSREVALGRKGVHHMSLLP